MALPVGRRDLRRQQFWQSCGLGAVLPILNIVPLCTHVPAVRWAGWGGQVLARLFRFTLLEFTALVCRSAVLGTRCRHPTCLGARTSLQLCSGGRSGLGSSGLPCGRIFSYQPGRRILAASGTRGALQSAAIRIVVPPDPS